jgi:SAM-dependent methyltransferase
MRAQCAGLDMVKEDRGNFQSHVISDQKSRVSKAKKIARVIQKHASLRFGNMLEVGTGSGFIVRYFSDIGYSSRGAYAVDIIDERQVKSGYNFQIVTGTHLPYSNNAFELVVSNHVIEHVGNSESQLHHLQEIYRVLEPGGILYLAVPNKWRIVEPHYRLPFLSWLSEPLATTYVRFLGRGSHYDCKPLSRDKAVNLLQQQNFRITDVTLNSIKVFLEIEETGLVGKLLERLPSYFWKQFLPIIPTLIYVCQKPIASDAQ